MMTTVLNKIKVQPTWNKEQTQAGTARMMANQLLSAMTVLAKYGDEAIKEFDQSVRSRKIEYYKSLGVKTPIDLVKAQAEFETNVFGSEIEYWGDEKTAHLCYKTCGMWDAIEKYGELSKEQEEKMGEHFQTCVQNTAREFGFKGDVKFEGEECATVTYTK